MPAAVKIKAGKYGSAIGLLLERGGAFLTRHERRSCHSSVAVLAATSKLASSWCSAPTFRRCSAPLGHKDLRTWQRCYDTTDPWIFPKMKGEVGPWKGGDIHERG